MKTTEQSHRLLSILALVVSSVGVGSALIFVKLSEVDPSATVMLRMFIASFIIGTANAFTGRGREKAESQSRLSRLRLVGILILSSVLFCLDILSNHWSVVYTSVTNATLLMNLSPIFVAMLAYLFFGERQSAIQTVCLLMAVVGGVLLVVTGKDTELRSVSLKGDGLALLSAIFYAVYLILTKWIRKQLGADVITFWNSLISALVLLPLVLATSDPVLPQTLSGYAVILALAIGTQLCGHGLMAYALHHVPATLAAASTLSQPILAVVLAWIFLDETVTGGQFVGGAFILAGLYFYSKSPAVDQPAAQRLQEKA